MGIHPFAGDIAFRLASGYTVHWWEMKYALKSHYKYHITIVFTVPLYFHLTPSSPLNSQDLVLDKTPQAGPPWAWHPEAIQEVA